MSYHNISRFLMDGEEIEKEWASKDWDGIYATQYRIFLVKNSFWDKKFIEASYNHISSIEFCKVRPK